jgi:hypothetical protein
MVMSACPSVWFISKLPNGFLWFTWVVFNLFFFPCALSYNFSSTLCPKVSHFTTGKSAAAGVSEFPFCQHYCNKTLLPVELESDASDFTKFEPSQQFRIRRMIYMLLISITARPSLWRRGGDAFRTVDNGLTLKGNVPSNLTNSRINLPR